MKIDNPVKFVSLGVISAIVILIVVAFIAGMSTSGGEQLPMVIFSYTFKIISIVGLAFSILSVFVYRKLFKEYKYGIGFLVLLFALLLYWSI